MGFYTNFDMEWYGIINRIIAGTHRFEKIKK